MSDANSISADVSGVATNGDPEMWRNVLARHPRNIGDVVNDPDKGPWNSVHNGQNFQGTYDAFEQIVTVAEQIAWVHTFSNGKTYDSGDVLIAMGEFLVKQGLL
ncbi:hypothetical protein C1Y40_04629 [Mycobacterium talmoniae]|uniref:Uncharacterized protein n=1 Tax=Mycobacterium talmoniae TaxID=1858794 RepID=A0A2S8BEW5_9MYCO|nr:hypothetical protein C1Y40_04629 [Mycobacterium talmoniae]